MKKIIIIGAPGVGKSTLAGILHDIARLPVIYLDALYWKPVWRGISKAAWVTLQQELVQGEEWIIDGNYQSTVDIRLQAADTIIFLDMPRYLYVWRVIKRQFFSWRKYRPDIGEGCVQKITWRYLYELWNFPTESRKLLLEKLLMVSNKKHVIQLTSRDEVSHFVRNMRIMYEEKKSPTFMVGDICY